MAFVYHLVAEDFRGEELLPINTLRDTYPDLYEIERAKYQGREGVLTYRVPFMNVPWGDTVNLAALDPVHLVQTRKELGLPSSRLLQRRIVRIPVERLIGRNAVVYNSATHWINSSPGEDVALSPPESEFEPFEIGTYSEQTETPVLHIEYLERQRDRDEYALGFVFVRHVLVEGSIDITGLDRSPF
jgi:hypothetical protein